MTTLVLGATSRIAQQIAQRYAESGDKVFVAARDVEEAERIAADLAVRHQVKALAGRFDALATDDHSGLIDHVEAELGPVTTAILAFGDMGDQDRSQESFADAKRVIDVNYTGAVSICEALAAKMTSRGAGTIVGVGSVAGDRGRKSNYIYGSAKGAFGLYLQGLRNRLHSEGVHVMTAKLGFVDTRMTYGMATKIPVASPEAASAAIFEAARRRVDVLYYPSFWRAIMGVIKGIPEKAFKRLSL